MGCVGVSFPDLLMCLLINLSGMFTLICSIYLRRVFNSRTVKTARIRLCGIRVSWISSEWSLHRCLPTENSQLQKDHGLWSGEDPPPYAHLTMDPFYTAKEKIPLLHTSFWQDRSPSRHSAPRLLPSSCSWTSSPTETWPGALCPALEPLAQDL